jgi:GntR family transcriptional regulator
VHVDSPIQFVVNPGSAEPIYRQLVEQLRRRVAAGHWVAGQELPSVRELALQLAVNPMTVSKAYSLLEAEGLLQRRRGLAMVIAPTHGRPLTTEERLTQLRPTLQRAAAEARQLGIANAEALRELQRCLDHPEAPPDDAHTSNGDPS